MHRKSLLIKLIIFGSVLSILPVVFVGVFSYIQSSKQVQERVNQAELQFLKQVNLNVEQVLKTVDHTLTNLADSNVMSNALYNPLGASNFQLYNNLRNEIVHLQSFDTKVEDVIILNKQQDWLIKNSGIKRFSQHIDTEQYGTLMQLEHASSWTLLQKNKFADALSSHSCPYIIGLVKKLPSITIDKYGFAMATIPACEIAAMIAGGEEPEELIIVNNDQQIMVHRDTAMIGEPLMGHPLFHSGIGFENSSGQMQAEYNKHHYTVTYYKSSFNDWVYLSIVSIDQLTKESRQIGWFTFIISLIIIVLSILFVWLATKRLYSPVNHLVMAAIQGRGAMPGDKAVSELQVIEDHMKQLFYSNRKLEHEVRNHADQISSLFLQRLYGGSLKDAEIVQKMDYFGFAETVGNWRYMVVLTIQVDTLESTRYEAKDMELLQFAILNIAEEIIAKGSRFPVVMLERSVVMLVGFDQSDIQQVESTVYQLTESMKNASKQYLELSISIGISLPFQDIRAASRAYDEALEALKHRIRLGKGVIIPYSTLNAGKPSVIDYYPSRIEHELIDAIKVAEQDAALDLLANWMDETIRKLQSPAEYQLALVRLLNRLLVLGQEAGAQLSQTGAYKVSLYEEVLSLHVSEEIEEWFKEKLIIPLLQLFEERRDSQDHKLSEKIIDLIQNHFDSEFTLEDCAVKLHYNASYLSSVFKKETNYSFSEYLSMYRLQMAKQWLTETNMTVKEIADRLKYTNSHNFIRSFRKQEEMTPGQYREKFRRV